jgi:hypothetical protein
MEYTPEDRERATAKAAATREKENIRVVELSGYGGMKEGDNEGEEGRSGKWKKVQATGRQSCTLIRAHLVSITAKSPPSRGSGTFPC